MQIFLDFKFKLERMKGFIKQQNFLDIPAISDDLITAIN
nr:unnamed protein product [Callosobruchus analis]